MTAIRPGLHNTCDLGRTAKVDLEHGTDGSLRHPFGSNLNRTDRGISRGHRRTCLHCVLDTCDYIVLAVFPLLA